MCLSCRTFILILICVYLWFSNIFLNKILPSYSVLFICFDQYLYIYIYIKMLVTLLWFHVETTLIYGWGVFRSLFQDGLRFVLPGLCLPFGLLIVHNNKTMTFGLYNINSTFTVRKSSEVIFSSWCILILYNR